MKLHIITVGTPKLAYAQSGWQEYWTRLSRYHTIRVTHIPDKHAYNAAYIQEGAGKAFITALTIDGRQLSSPELASFLEQRALDGRELCMIIGGPEGLPQDIQNKANFCWSFSNLTFPHDLAMVVLLESLYRASTINAGQPYHK